MKTKAITTTMIMLLAGMIVIAVPVQASGTTINYGDITLNNPLPSGSQKGHFCDVWDLTASDLVISFTVDLTGMVDDYGGGAHAWAELGVRHVGYGDFNPTWMSEGAGVWLATDYDWTVNTFDPDPVPPGPILDIDDKLILQKGGGWDESTYNLPKTPPDPWTNYGIWFDRDGVDPWQATYWGCIDGGTYNTAGRYAVIITLHATGATSGTAYMAVNGVSQGFWVGGWKNAQPEIYPAGMTFTGDMTRMQVFYGLYGYGAIHTVVFKDITVTGHSRTLNLQFDPSSSSIVLITDTATLTVRLTADGTVPVPVPGEIVTFSSDPNGLSFTNIINPTNATGYATVTTTSSTVAVYTVTATVCGAISDTWTLVFYEAVGMAAGGGWYYPLADDESTMPGTASFGFIAKYIKGSSTGNLEFQYHVEDKLNLKCTSITYLVVSGSNAHFGGTATVNGASGYYFRVIAKDNGEPGVGKDWFSIKIWLGDPNIDGTLIHSSHNTLAGGNIMVRTK